MITTTPTSYELHDDKELLAQITMVDEGASTVEIKTVVNAGSWPELSRYIYEALQAMHPEGKP